MQLCGGASVQRFMWPYLVVDISPVIGLALADGRMNGRMRGGARFGRPHAFCSWAALLILRMGRAGSWLTDAQPTPPIPPAANSPTVNATEGGTVVDPKSPWAASWWRKTRSKALLEQRTSLWLGGSRISSRNWLFQIADRQGFNPRAVAGPIPAFEVDGPDIVGTSRHGAVFGAAVGGRGVGAVVCAAPVASGAASSAPECGLLAAGRVGGVVAAEHAVCGDHKVG